MARILHETQGKYGEHDKATANAPKVAESSKWKCHFHHRCSHGDRIGANPRFRLHFPTVSVDDVGGKLSHVPVLSPVCACE
jgi:hypothetical protein